MNAAAGATWRVAQAAALACLAAAGILGCSERSYQSFVASHDAIRPGMTIGEVFDSGLADYMVGMGVKNARVQRGLRRSRPAQFANDMYSTYGIPRCSLLPQCSGFDCIAT